MKCNDLAARIERLRPDAGVRDVARLCLLLSNSIPDAELLVDDDLLAEVWRKIDIRMQAATDQHAAMTEELEMLARSSPETFTPQQVWVLIRAIKVQSQILQMYLGANVPSAL